MQFTLYPKQGQVLTSSKHKIGFIAGRGAGKTKASAIRMLVESCRTPDLYGLYAPTFPMLRDTTLRTFLETCAPWITGHSETKGIITMRSGAEIICRSLDEPEHARGPNLRGACIDEGGSISKAAYLILRGCLRAHGELGWMCVATTPKGKSHWTYDVFGPNADNDTETIFAATGDNVFNDPGFEAGLRRDYSSAFARQEIDGQFVDLAGTMFQREWFPIVTDYPRDAQVCRYWDLAATRVKRPGDDPDWTCGGLVALHEGIWYILDMQRLRETAAIVEARIAQTAILDGREIMIRMEEEMGASGKSLVDHYRRNILIGYDFNGDHPTGPKEVRAQTWAGAAEHGNVRLLSGVWNKAFLDEVEQFPSPGAHDDQTDCISGGCKCLAERFGTPHIYSAGPNPVIEKMLTDVDTEIDALITSLPVDQREAGEQLRRTYAGQT